MKIIISGSRTVWDANLLNKVIKASTWEGEISEVVCGDAAGVDTLGDRWAAKHGIPIKHFPAKWSDITVKGAIITENKHGKYNKKAGIDRNEAMGDYADALIAIIKDNSPGTTHMIDYMKKLNKPTYIWEI